VSHQLLQGCCQSKARIWDSLEAEGLSCWRWVVTQAAYRMSQQPRESTQYAMEMAEIDSRINESSKHAFKMSRDLIKTDQFMVSNDLWKCLATCRVDRPVVQVYRKIASCLSSLMCFKSETWPSRCRALSKAINTCLRTLSLHWICASWPFRSSLTHALPDSAEL
jgi:hypothetical protein